MGSGGMICAAIVCFGTIGRCCIGRVWSCNIACLERADVPSQIWLDVDGGQHGGVVFQVVGFRAKKVGGKDMGTAARARVGWLSGQVLCTASRDCRLPQHAVESRSTHACCCRLSHAWLCNNADARTPNECQPLRYRLDILMGSSNR